MLLMGGQDQCHKFSSYDFEKTPHQCCVVPQCLSTELGGHPDAVKDRLEEANAALMDAMTFKLAPPGKSRKVMITGDISLPGKNWSDCYHKK